MPGQTFVQRNKRLFISRAFFHHKILNSTERFFDCLLFTLNKQKICKNFKPVRYFLCSSMTIIRMKRENMKKLIFLFRKIVFVNITGSSHVATKVFNIGVLRSEISSEIFSVLEQRQYKTDAMDANNWLFKKKCRAFHSFTMREKRAISKLADIFVLSSRSYIVLALPSVSNSKHEPDRQN